METLETLIGKIKKNHNDAWYIGKRMPSMDVSGTGSPTQNNQQRR